MLYKDETTGPGRFFHTGKNALADIRRDIVELLPRLRRLAWAIVRDRQESEDLLHLTIERALANHANRDPDARLDMWMFRIMKNLWVDEIRRRGRWSRLVTSLPDGVEVGDEGGYAEDLVDAVELARIRVLVEDLPEEQRMAIKLVLLAGHSYSEAAEILDVPEGTLTSRLARGRAALIEHYTAGRTRH